MPQTVHMNAATDTAISFLPLAQKLADAAACVTMRYFRAGFETDNKEAGRGFDPVTEADRNAEQAIRALLEEHVPDHGINGEEFGIKTANSPWCWYLDPIDGTRAFISGLPTWGTLIALAYEGRPVLGVIDQPFTRERYVGTRAHSWLNGNLIRVSGKTDLQDAVLTSTDPYLFNADDKPYFDSLHKATKLTRFGLDCYGYAVLASGHMDIVIESGLKPYDYMALAPVIEGAGGMVSDWNGDPVHEGSGDMLASASVELHQAALEKFRKIKTRT